MNERIIEIILYLVNQIRKDIPIESIDVKGLASDGYTDAEIGMAFSWIADRAVFGTEGEATKPSKSFRILHESERMLFRTEAYGYLLLMIEIGLLNEAEFEMIINRAQIAGYQGLGVAEAKELVSSLLAESGDVSFGGSRLMLNSHDTVH